MPNRVEKLEWTWLCLICEKQRSIVKGLGPVGEYPPEFSNRARFRSADIGRRNMQEGDLCDSCNEWLQRRIDERREMIASVTEINRTTD